MNLPARLLAACSLIAGSQLIVLSIHQGMEPKRAKLTSSATLRLPDAIGDFVGRDEPLDEAIVKGAEAAVMLNRVYRNHTGDAVIANVGLWTSYRTIIPHRPEICYPRAGWEISSHHTVKLPLGSSMPQDMKILIFQRDNRRIAVAYWAQMGDEEFCEDERVRETRQRLRISGGDLPLLVKVMLQTDAQDINQAETTLQRMASALALQTRAIH